MAIPQVAIVGRPNVGKSSLFNWLAGRRIAIVDPTAGVTRDRLATLVRTGDRFFELIDTGGLGVEDIDGLTADIERQIAHAIDQAAVILFVVDTRSGIMPLDDAVVKRLRYVTKPIICVANKCDTAEMEPQTAEFYKLGRGKLVCVSAMQNRGRTELLDLIRARLPAADAEVMPDQDTALKVAIVGRRNTGKSTFINCLAEGDRVIVSEVPGTTRDSVDVRFERDGKTIIAIDTAGVRRKSSVATDVEFYSMARAERSIRRADVVLLFLDSAAKVSKVDKQLAHYVLEEHKPAVFVVNKWDLMKGMPTGKFAKYLKQTFPSLDFVPMAFITAQDGKNVQAVLNLAQNMHKQATARVSTADLNKVLRDAMEHSPPPMRQNRRAKVYYATQVAAGPPTIVLFTNSPELFDNTYQRYLLKTFRDLLPFHDVPIKMYLRAKKREDQPEGELEKVGKPAASASRKPGRKPARKAAAPPLEFRSKMSDEEMKQHQGHYESELWQDL